MEFKEIDKDRTLHCTKHTMMKENLPCGHSNGNKVTRWKCAAATADTTVDTAVSDANAL